MIWQIPVLNLRESHIRTLVSLIEMSDSTLVLSRYCWPINQERGVIRRREKRGNKDSVESRD